MTGYKMNFATRTLTITKAFAKQAMLINTDEANYIKNLRTIVPDLKIAYKTHVTKKTRKPSPHKGLSYPKMEDYIKHHENAEEIMVAFNSVKEIAKVQLSPYNYVCKWFMTQFPDYKSLPTLHNGKITAVEVVIPRNGEKANKETGEAMVA